MSKKLLSFLIIFSVIIACKPDEEKDTFWESITTSDFYNPFIFVFSNSDLAICADHAQPKLESIITGQETGISPERVNGVMMYPSLLDNQYSYIAEEIKFLFDINGNNTLETWPAYFNNMTCYNIDSTSWLNSIQTQHNSLASIKLGLDHAINDNELRIYARGQYLSPGINTSIAAYVYRKSELGMQETAAGKQLTTFKNKVIGSMTPTFGKIIANGNAGDEIREILTFSLGAETLSNLGVVVVLYQMEGIKPISVINSAKLENF